MTIFEILSRQMDKYKGIKLYKKELEVFLFDLKLAEDEKAKLEHLVQLYGLTEKLLEETHKKVLSEVFTTISADMRITDEEGKALCELEEQLGVARDEYNFDQDIFNKCHILHLIDNNKLPELSSEQHNIPINFKKDEILYFGGNATLRRFKNVTRKLNYGGLTYSTKIMKGLRYRAGSLNYERISETVLDELDRGGFYLTNQRIGYIGQKKHFSVPYNKIASIEVRSGGLFIFKEGRQNPFILTLDDYEVPVSIVSTILNT